MSFAAPLFLAGLALLLPVVVAFLVKRRRRVVRVPSVLRWQAVALARHRSRRLRHLSRWAALVACVLAVGLLALAAARPLGAGTGQTTVVVVDTSASMGGLEADAPLAEAREAVAELLRLRGPHDRVALVAAGDAPARLAGPTSDGALLRAGLGQLAPSREGDVAGALRLAAQLAAAEEDARILLLHDGGADLTRLDGALPVPLEERVWGEGRENLGLSVLAARPAPDARSDGDREVLVAVSAAGERLRRARVTLLGDGVPLATETVQVPPGEEGELRLRVRLPVARIEARVAPADGLGDALPGDDRAALALGRVGAPPVRLLVGAGAGGGAGEGGGESAARFFAERALRAAGVTDLATLEEGEAPPEDAVVVSLGAPARLPARPLLVLGGGGGARGRWPEGVRPLPPLEGAATALRRVDDRHPLMRGVSLDGVTIVRAEALDPGEGEALVELDGAGEGGAVVSAGGVGRGRWAHLGLAPDGSDVVLRVAYPVLVANALAWLGGGGAMTVAETAPRGEIALASAPPTGASPASLPSLPVPPLPVLFAALAALLLALEGAAYAKGWVR
ncbi:MAG TPA: VWA domain-containing protein [Polyangiaceae bacterium LLY-WYZ-15_(1-7)]|nr:VWA domain-containing protein [Polyangiaceae bacterium LLY-WYZ-15_(1-7)]HJL13518.1 VWA domain-containing protein [Polyangiaceae bacterium LLY-WYZ-15_(1-7)]HJL21484.1 VWA domain-containing protein [Polyangiaceae bacterium LLY-WYZ-15_(1-7)]